MLDHQSKSSSKTQSGTQVSVFNDQKSKYQSIRSTQAISRRKQQGYTFTGAVKKIIVYMKTVNQHIQNKVKYTNTYKRKSIKCVNVSKYVNISQLTC